MGALLLVLLGATACAGLWGFDPLSNNTQPAGDDGGNPQPGSGDDAASGLDAATPDAPAEAGTCPTCDAPVGACGTRGQACCQNSSCSQGLTCLNGACTGNVLLFGGMNASYFLGDAWEYNGTSWTRLANGPSARGWPSVGGWNGQVLVYGGYFGATINAPSGVNYADVWSWDGVGWKQLPDGPPARDDSSMALLGTTAVLFGGTGNALLNETWLYDGSTWAQWPGGGASPSPRLDAAITTFNGSIVMFGGTVPGAGDGGSDITLNDLWQFDGTTWTDITPTSGALPPTRGGASLTPLNGKLVLYGGGWGTTTYDDTWVWDGSSWTNLQVPGTGGLSKHAAVTFGNSVVLFGGWDVNGNVTDQTWLFNGSGWTNAGITGPGKRATHGMVAR